VASATFCDVSAVRRVFTDAAAPVEMIEKLADMGIEVTGHG
jgi:DeoR/GlpR family transcriptional regulator of sugar metabolism